MLKSVKVSNSPKQMCLSHCTVGIEIQIVEKVIRVSLAQIAPVKIQSEERDTGPEGDSPVDLVDDALKGVSTAIWGTAIALTNSSAHVHRADGSNLCRFS